MDWKIETLEYNNDSDKGVTVAHWSCTHTTGSFSARNIGTVGLTPIPSASGYIAYEDLTEEDVIGWVQENVDVTSISQSIANSINDQINPPTLKGIPWE
jgi:hypothetical protein